MNTREYLIALVIVCLLGILFYMLMIG